MNQCEDCGTPTIESETVWVRAEPTGQRTDWNKPQCIECWERDNPNRMPILLNIQEDK